MIDYLNFQSFFYINPDLLIELSSSIFDFNNYIFEPFELKF